ncbi:hypothetical protein [Hutsoniella sourekii]|uniref:hypothetical protein n=1 Tax=Hutsoniella sourekii TaxID=87650 RepID=UPI00048474D1|nr:hypothetical protein [Hutsoniella sourekii]
MNRQETLDRIAKVEEELAKAKEELERLDQARWAPGYEECYFFINHNGCAYMSRWDNQEFEKSRVIIGNVFKTEQEAEHAVERLKIRAELLDAGGRDKLKQREENYSITYKPYEYKLGVTFALDAPLFDFIYFDSENEVKEAIKQVGEDRIKKYMFGVES